MEPAQAAEELAVAAANRPTASGGGLLQAIAQRRAIQQPPTQTPLQAAPQAQQTASYGDMGGKGGGGYGGGGVAMSGSPTDSSSGTNTSGLSGYSNAYLSVEPNSNISPATNVNQAPTTAFSPFGTTAVPGIFSGPTGAVIGGLNQASQQGYGVPSFSAFSGINTGPLSYGNVNTDDGFAAPASGGFATEGGPTDASGFGAIGASGGEGGGTSPGGGGGGAGGGGGK